MIVPVTNFTQIPASNKQGNVQSAIMPLNSVPMQRFDSAPGEEEHNPDIAAIADAANTKQHDDPKISTTEEHVIDEGKHNAMDS